MTAMTHFEPQLFDFLRDLRENNDRDWFKARKARYEAELRDPMLSFIEAFAKPLKRITPHFTADPRPVGGSLFRIYRDTRFSKDKTPYKIHAAAHFKHKRAKDVHAPGFYLHLEPGKAFFGAGIWQPPSDALRKIRDSLVARPEVWKKAVGGRRFKAECTLDGATLKRPPRGYDPDHPLIEDLKRKDFTCFTELSEEAALAPGFLDRFTTFCRAASPLQKFLTEALEIEF